ncbi:MAG TPA: AGE family epimerase/isomerase [Bacteroidales bacterium]|nr:AGE family epimerase/isomerase [Bacteroidales bacterium]HRW95310.1 AGE family epimerase/isomerase [Bacteroidales bacterium]
MASQEQIENLRRELHEELTQNILPYWIKLKDSRCGGYYGRVTGKEELLKEAPKGAVLQSRILWTFSAAARVLRNKDYLAYAAHAKDFILDKMYDKEYGGIFWSVDHKGNMEDPRKQFYALGFALYGLTEYHRATGDPVALAKAVDLFNDIEAHSSDQIYGGYLEAADRDWSEIRDVRLSAKDANEKKTMNTHLHIMEPYTNLFRVWKDPGLEQALARLVEVFLDKIVNPKTHHLSLFFDEEYHVKGSGLSYGHDIEASWLLMEAARELADYKPGIYGVLLSRVTEESKNIAYAALKGLQPDGSLIYEVESSGRIDKTRHWWVQAETVVGLFYLYTWHKVPHAMDMALNCWNYIKEHIRDNRNGEWFWSPGNTTDDKAGFWKCPYHNSRMCLEIIEHSHQLP